MGKKSDLSPCKKAEVKALVKAKLFSNREISRRLKHPTKIMILSVISGKVTGRLYVVKGMMQQDQHKDVLQNRLIPQLEEWRTIHFYARWSSLTYSSVYQSFFGRTKYPSVGLAG
ncbi:hypothetical protein TNCV_4165631 [Trichonephila clavipes]|nr:hypothetical protein TNCV_4165631 [Trichonephila clavipes]